ncbi:TolC family protein [Chitinophaga rhizosphaerae]|uniref:TolC family protein n=1 Tax=Chitinophaga rhizosphaerae TaxID=1864947 RepID=UPI0013DF2A91|nr:TolC family protein [Chitinophaga rhizosphaerae]
MKFSPAFTALIVALVLSVRPAMAQEGEWTYQRCYEYALSHNLTLQQSVLNKRLAELTLKVDRMSMLPTLLGNGSAGYIFGRSINITTNQFDNKATFNASLGLSAGADLFGWFQKRNTVASSKYEVYAQNYLLEKARNDMGVNVANAFLQILLAGEQVKISRAQVDLSKAQLENTKKLVLAGSVPESNQADLEAQLARDSSTLVTAENAVILRTLQMKALLNLGFEVPFDTKIPDNIAAVPVINLTETSPEMVFSSALSIQPQYRSDEMRVKSADKTLSAAKGAMYPRLRANAGADTRLAGGIRYEQYGPDNFVTYVSSIGFPKSNPLDTVFTYDKFNNRATRKYTVGRQLSDNFGQNIGITLSFPIFNGWQLRGQVERAKIDLENRKLTQDINRLQLRQDVYTAHADAVGAYQKYLASITTERASQKAFDFATKRFEVGLMNTVEYVTTQTNLFKAQIERVSALYDYIFKVKLLEFYRDQKITL